MLLLLQMVNNHSTFLNDKVGNIIKSWNFFSDLKILAFVLRPLCNAVLALERKTANLGDCYLRLARVAAIIKKLPRSFNSDFRNHCVAMINKRFEEFDDDNYLLTFFLNPRFRGWFFFYFTF